MSIPEQVVDYPLIRVCHPDCNVSSHGDCNSPGKRPVSDIHSDKILRDIRSWIRIGGNYGVVARSDNSLVIFDSDSEIFTETVRSELPETFTVQTGSGNYHYYFRSNHSENNNIRDESGEVGSIRADNYQAVGPGSVHPETGNKYRVYRDTEISLIPTEQISDFLSVLDSRLRREDGGGGKSGGGGRSSRNNVTKASDLDISPTLETLSALEFVNSRNTRESIAKVIDHRHPPRQTRVWALSWLYSVAGLREGQIRRLLVELADWATDKKRIRTEVRSLIHSSINGDRANESVDLDRHFGNDDMDLDRSESRKTESGSEGTRQYGGDNTMSLNYDTESSLVHYEADSPDEAEDGDRVIKLDLTHMSGTDDSGDRVDTDFVSFRKGTLRDNGEFGVSPEFNGDPSSSKSLGSADSDDLQLIADAIQELVDEELE